MLFKKLQISECFLKNRKMCYIILDLSKKSQLEELLFLTIAFQIIPNRSKRTVVIPHLLIITYATIIICVTRTVLGVFLTLVKFCAPQVVLHACTEIASTVQFVHCCLTSASYNTMIPQMCDIITSIPDDRISHLSQFDFYHRTNK